MNGILVQFISSIILAMPTFLSGFSVAWCSYTIKTLESEDSPLGIPITNNDGSLLGSLLMLGCLISTLVGGYIADSIGRKKTEILCGLLFVLSWSIITVATSVTQVLVGRFLTGIGSGAHTVVVYIFISEYSQISVRGTMITTVMFAYSSGVLLSYVFGWLLSYEIINYIILMLCVAFVGLVSFLKETPAYLLSTGQHREALNSLKFYRGTSRTTPDIVEEMTYIWSQRYHSIEKDVEILNKIKLDDDVKTKALKVRSWNILWSSQSMRRAMIMITLHLILVILMGMIGVQTYAGLLFTKAAPNFSPHICSIILAISILLGCGVSSVISEMVERRTLMMVSTTLSALCLAILSSLLRWSWAPEWAVPATILLFCFSFHIGATNVPLMQLGESFVSEVKSVASVIAMCGMWAGNIIVLAVFGSAVEYLGLDGVFFVFALIGGFSTIVTFLFMKETKGIPVEAIQDMYTQGYLYRSKTRTKHSK